MRVLYAVPWIEVEFGWGERPEGFKVYDNLLQCIEETKKSSEDGNYTDGYFGPTRPLSYYETNDEITGEFPQFVDEVKFRTGIKYIK